MRYRKKQLSVALLLFLGIPVIYAQESTVSSGGKTSGSGGTLDFSIGQVVYTALSGPNGSLSQGVQQAYEIYEIAQSTDDKISSQQFSVYPNPTTDNLTVNCEQTEAQKFSILLYDIEGKLLQKNESTGAITEVPMDDLTPSTYIMKLIGENSTELKAFKIIKK